MSRCPTFYFANGLITAVLCWVTMLSFKSFSISGSSLFCKGSFTSNKAKGCNDDDNYENVRWTQNYSRQSGHGLLERTILEFSLKSSAKSRKFNTTQCLVKGSNWKWNDEKSKKSSLRNNCPVIFLLFVPSLYL